MLSVAEQYLSFKKENDGFVLLFQIGEFFELMFDDAIFASKETGLHLTTRSKFNNIPVPLCGFPRNSLFEHVRKFLLLNKRLVVVEEYKEDSLVKRHITQRFSPATVTDDRLIGDDANNFIICVSQKNNRCFLSYFDFTTQEYGYSVCSNDLLLQNIDLISPKEIMILSDVTFDCDKLPCVYFSAETFDHINIVLGENLSSFLADIDSDYVDGFVSIFRYIFYIHPEVLISPTRKHCASGVCFLDSGALKIVRPNSDIRNSLFEHINYTSTPLGSRGLELLIRTPMTDVIQINKRLDMVECIISNEVILESILPVMRQIKCIRRIANRICSSKQSLSDHIKLLQSIEAILMVLDVGSTVFAGVLPSDIDINSTKDLFNFLSKSISCQGVDECNLLVYRAIVKPSFSSVLLHHHRELELINRTLVDLTIKYNILFGSKVVIKQKLGIGYVVEVKKNATIPDGFDIVSIGSVVTILSNKILSDITLRSVLVCEKLCQAEALVLKSIAEKIMSYCHLLDVLSIFIEEVDIAISMARVTLLYDYVRPIFGSEKRVVMKSMYHPILSRVKDVVSNDLDSSKTSLIFGSNMSGKSTFMRQIVICQIMAQIGCFVPAERCTTFVSDKILTRIGSGDDIYNEKSTFFTEMEELGIMLRHATRSSICVIDEIGRGTTHTEGLSIAFAAIKYMSSRGYVSFFATHYYELLGYLSGVDVYHMDVVDSGNSISFTYKVLLGQPLSHCSHGFYVAECANLPYEVIVDAKDFMCNNFSDFSKRA